MLISASITPSSYLSRLDRFRPPQLGSNLAALLIFVPFAIGQTHAANSAAGVCGPAAVPTKCRRQNVQMRCSRSHKGSHYYSALCECGSAGLPATVLASDCATTELNRKIRCMAEIPRTGQALPSRAQLPDFIVKPRHCESRQGSSPGAAGFHLPRTPGSQNPGGRCGTEDEHAL